MSSTVLPDASALSNASFADQDSSQGVVTKRKVGCDSHALELGPKRKPSHTDPLIHYGRHFGRTVHALCNVHLLLTNGVRRLTEFEDAPNEQFSPQEKKEHKIFWTLLRMVPNLEERLCTSSEEQLKFIGDMIQRGASGARSDDTKSLKSAVIDWITPRGVPLNPPLARNSKHERGFHHDATGSLLCPADLNWSDPEVKRKLQSPEYIVPGDQWPVLVYENYKPDPSDPWIGLFRSQILIRAFKHVFTSPSSVDKEPKATRSGNARIHGMISVTVASIAYIATQVRFALMTTPVFSRTDRATDSQRFYTVILNFLEDPEEHEEVNELLVFWNRHIFPEFFIEQRTITRESALAKLKERRARKKAGSSSAPAGQPRRTAIDD